MSDDQNRTAFDHQNVVPGQLKIPGGAHQQRLSVGFPEGNRRQLRMFSRIEDLPEEAAKDKESFLIIGAKSSLIIPYHVAGKPIACMTLPT